ncbi:MAG: hypothetical protein AAGK14_07805 [Verrucomicrobiota bacterium]
MDYSYHPELFEERSRLQEALEAEGVVWMQDYGAIDLMHAEFGLEVTAIKDERIAAVVMQVMAGLFPHWPYSDCYYRDSSRETGWKAIRHRRENAGEREAF